MYSHSAASHPSWRWNHSSPRSARSSASTIARLSAPSRFDGRGGPSTEQHVDDAGGVDDDRELRFYRS
jgi:hypothetical protein